MKISGKHNVEEINGVRCSVVEKQADEVRAGFLKSLLEYNGYVVETQKNLPPPPKPAKAGTVIPPPPPNLPETYKIGVTEVTFNVSVMVFSRKLKTLDNKVLLPTYWTQEAPGYNDWYWKFESNKQ